MTLIYVILAVLTAAIIGLFLYVLSLKRQISNFRAAANWTVEKIKGRYYLISEDGEAILEATPKKVTR